MDQRSGHAPTTPTDRLTALRPPTSLADHQGGNARKPIRTDILVGMALIAAGVVVAIFLRGSQGGGSPEVVPAVPSSVPAASAALLDGEVLVSVALEDGEFPPQLHKGDVVRVIVTPNANGEGSVRALPERTIVHDVDAIDAGAVGNVVTLRTAASAALGIAASGPLRLVILEVGS